MFGTLLKGHLLSSLRNKDTMLWIALFPIVLSTLFFFAFGNLDSAEEFAPVPTAVVENEAYQSNAAFRTVLEEVSKEGDDQLLDLTVAANEEEARQLLRDGKVDGYLVDGDTVLLNVWKDGINQSILKGFLDSYQQTQASLERIIKENPQALQQGIEALTAGTKAEIEEVSLTQTKPSERVTYYYALLAMVCMYGSFQGVEMTAYLMGNLSALGARRGLAPIPKGKQVLADLLGSVLLHFGCVVLALGYITLVLRIDMGTKILPMLLTCLMGSLSGISLGVMVGAVFRFKMSVKTAILSSISMVLSFLAGLMVGGMNYVVAQNAPVLSWINPAARVSDAFYCLQYFDDYSRFWLNMVVLAVIAVVLFGISAGALRRQKYASL